MIDRKEKLKEGSKWLHKKEYTIVKVKEIEDGVVHFNVTSDINTISLVDFVEDFLENYINIDNQIEGVISDLDTEDKCLLEINVPVECGTELVNRTIFIEGSNGKVQSRLITKLEDEVHGSKDNIYWVHINILFSDDMNIDIDDGILICDHHARVEAPPVVESEFSQETVDKVVKILGGPVSEGDKHNNDAVGEAKKFDTDKTRYELLPPEALEEIAKVLTYGAKKYSARNWEKGISYHRLFGACMRHLWAWWAGQDKDPETRLSHLAHAGCCIMFLIHHQYWKIELASDLDDRPFNKKNECGVETEDAIDTVLKNFIERKEK